MGRSGGFVLAALVSVALTPVWGEAAQALLLLGPMAGYVNAFNGLFFLMGVAGVGYGGYHTIMEVWTNRQAGQWMWYALGTLGTAVLMFVIIPVIVTPGIALGATPDVGHAIGQVVCGD